MKTPWKIAAVAVGALFGYGLSAPKSLRADSEWKWCSEWDSKGKCITCFQLQDCGSQPVCCKIGGDS